MTIYIFSLNIAEVSYITLAISVAISLYVLLSKNWDHILSRSVDFSMPHYLLGIISGLSIFYAMINLSIKHQPYDYVMNNVFPDEPVIIPQTWQKPKEITLPPPPEEKQEIKIPTPTAKIIPVKILKEKLVVEDFTDIADTSTDNYDVDSMMQSTKAVAPQIVDRLDEDEIVLIPEQMPRFPGCEDTVGTRKEKRACAEQNLMAFIYKNIKYPQMDKEYRNEGTVIVRFVVDKEGMVSDIKIVRDVGMQCGLEAERVVRMMNNMKERWTPGKQRGRAVNVQFTLPIKFKLI